MLIEAGQPEILRAAQRDDNFKKQISDHVSGILQSVFGIHFWIKYRKSAEGFSNILYHLMTTISNLQTLGEEYTGMVQVDSSKMSLPKKHFQLLMVLLKTYGDTASIKCLQNLKRKIEQLPEEKLNHLAKNELLKVTDILKTFIPFISKFHLALFYLTGHYYEIANRLTGIKYVLVRYWLKDRSSLLAFKVLGMVTAIQAISSVLIDAFKYKNPNSDKLLESKMLADACDKCSLCLNARQHTSVTPCGHLFCWSCIIPWLQEQPKCPLCRQVFQPSRVVFLQNYSASG